MQILPYPINEGKYIVIIIIIIIIFIETRLQDSIGEIIKYRWFG